MFYADFYCHACRLVVEIEKAMDPREAAARHTALRTLAAQHRIVRIGADELPDVEAVLSKIADAIVARDEDYEA